MLYFIKRKEVNTVAEVRRTEVKSTRIKPQSALSAEQRENQIISLAMDEAERRIRDGTASSQLLSIFIKAGSIKEKKELELLEYQKELAKAKTENLQAAQNMNELLVAAMKAFTVYSGETDDDFDEDDFGL